MYLNNVWRPALSINGIAGIPVAAEAGNVLRANTEIRFSLRIPPNKDADEANTAFRNLITKDPLFNAKITILDGSSGNGFVQ